jgi:hypothetical protein
MTARPLRSRVRLGAAAAVLAAAAPAGAASPRGLEAPPLQIAAVLRVSPHAPDLEARPDVLRRLRATPHNYFRFVNHPFSAAVCGLFEDVRVGLPDVILHGDAHLEQYAVTSLGRGLTDFDDSARGPYVIDLVRFGVSLELAAREKGWADEDAVLDFLRGYEDALSDPLRESPPQEVVRRSRTRFAFDHRTALRRAAALIDKEPVAPAELAADFEAYAAALHAQDPSLPAAFFRIKTAGRLRIGIGSALDEKYLLRVEGWTASDDDDLVLEAKLVHALGHGGCLHGNDGPERVSLGMSLIARASFPYAGLFVHGGHALWVHGWTDDYVELSIESSFAESRDLRQVAYDVGIQLGHAHPREEPGKAPDRASREALLASERANEGRIRATIDMLTDATLAAWDAFRADDSSPRPSP